MKSKVEKLCDDSIKNHFKQNVLPTMDDAFEYYELFKHMLHEHDLALTCSELEDIVDIVKKKENE